MWSFEGKYMSNPLVVLNLPPRTGALLHKAQKEISNHANRSVFVSNRPTSNGRRHEFPFKTTVVIKKRSIYFVT